MERRASILDLIAIALGIVLIFSASAFAQGLTKGSTPAETSISRAPAYCSELTGAFRVCRVRLNEDGDAEFQVQKLGVTVAKIEADFWANVAVGPKDFLAYRGDMDRDGADEIVLISFDGVTQGMGVSYATAYIFDGRTIESGGGPISIPIQEFGENESFVYDRQTRRTNVLITYWSDYDSIEPKRPPGLYLVGKWFGYEKARLKPMISRPTLARRFLNSFASQRDNGWFENRKPYTWLRDRRTHRLLREPGDLKPLGVRQGRITGYTEPDGAGAEFAITTVDGTSFKLRFDHPDHPARESEMTVDAVGIWSGGYLYPNPRSGGLRLSAFAEKIEGRRVRVETYRRTYGDEFVRIWLLD